MLVISMQSKKKQVLTTDRKERKRKLDIIIMPFHMSMIFHSFYAACSSDLSSSRRCRDAEKASENSNKDDQKYETASVRETTKGREQNSPKKTQ